MKNGCGHKTKPSLVELLLEPPEGCRQDLSDRGARFPEGGRLLLKENYMGGRGCIQGWV